MFYGPGYKAELVSQMADGTRTTAPSHKHNKLICIGVVEIFTTKWLSQSGSHYEVKSCSCSRLLCPINNTVCGAVVSWACDVGRSLFFDAKDAEQRW